MYYRARYYDPTLQRFISRDSYGLAAGVNVYAYANNSSIGLVDPSGHQPVNAGGNYSMANAQSSAEVSSSYSPGIAAGGMNSPTSLCDSSGHAAGMCTRAGYGESNQTLTSALRDTGRGAANGVLNVAEGALNLVNGATPADPYYIPIFQGIRPGSYETPAFGETVEFAASVGVFAGAGRMGAGAGEVTNLRYADRVRERAVQDPVSHNFPYSFDRAILSTPPIPQSNGYNYYRQPGSMTGSTYFDNTGNRIQTHKDGFYEIGVRRDGVIDHRFFRPNK